MHIITYKEDDLIDFSDVIYEGHYCMSQKASLSTETGRVSVIVKSCRGLYNSAAIMVVHMFKFFSQYFLTYYW